MRTAGLAVPALVVATHKKPPAIELLGHVNITPAMFAQPMHDDDYASHRFARSQWPVAHHHVVSVGGNEGGDAQLLSHGIWAITCATAAVSFLA